MIHYMMSHNKGYISKRTKKRTLPERKKICDNKHVERKHNVGVAELQTHYKQTGFCRSSSRGQIAEKETAVPST